MSWSLNPANRVALWVCGGVMLALLAVVAVLAWQVSRLSERAGTLASERDTAIDQRDEARAETALQAMNFNRVNQITEEARRVRQQSAITAQNVRRDIHAHISAQSCSSVLLPADDSDRLLGYVNALRDEALRPDAAGAAGPDAAVTPARRLTWGQAVEWLPLLMGDIQSCNADKAGLRRIDKERVSEATKKN
ncbi:hypothetical protein DOH76_07920 [Salmonella enterica subsp. enterica serovar Oranienburg]|uniref:DUF2570 domain-containing protein n=1 Tax=Salmonella enterica TaxID=28901 RepID=A0A742KWM4_SALER|nr:hypothetical protein [Salmonella enterica]EBG5024750.1 hypothetical protein [Salmonella enterica subsp. enterica serovar Oranienburg]ECX0641804.1 hypothetical protein [Salmonella enterica subsp. enterica serovar Newport]EHJ5406337.1 hypothetical protein [Salmonella enterica subsp. enterica serovar Wedding]EAS1264377.1 hypothetical protein [Salmonella enterica]